MRAPRSRSTAAHRSHTPGVVGVSFNYPLGRRHASVNRRRYNLRARLVPISSCHGVVDMRPVPARASAPLVVRTSLAVVPLLIVTLAVTARAQQPGGTLPWPTAITARQIGPAAFGGRIDDIEAVPDDPRIIFVGTASGGVFRSRNNGVTWDPVFDAYGTALSIGDIAIAPTDPNVVWAGTGEANGRQSSTWGDGVYRSLDGGTTWQFMGLRETQTIGRIVVSPRDANTVFVAAVGHLFGPNPERGLYRTRDGGATWQKVLAVDDNTGAIDVAIEPDGRTLFAATYERRRRAWGFVGGGPGSALWRSLDGGDSWQRLTDGLPTGDVGRIGIALAASAPDVVYAIVEHHTAGGVYRSNDRGATWTRQSGFDPRPSYYSQIRVDPKNADHVWVLGTPLSESIDAGRTFTSDSTAVDIHVDHHALWIDPAHPRHMMLGNDGGLYFTYDGARHWDFIDNLPIGQYYDVTVDDRDPYWIYGGTQDNGTWGIPSRSDEKVGILNSDVINVAYGDGFQAAADPTDPRLVYANSQSGRAYVVDLETREERGITPVSADAKEHYRFNWNTPILLSPDDPHVYFYGGNELFRTDDHGTTWRAISPDLTRHQDWRKLDMGAGLPPRRPDTPSRDDGVSDYGTITTIAQSYQNPGTLWAGTDDGKVQMTTDSGAHWTDLTSRFPLAGPRWVSRIVASAFDARTTYVAFDGHYDDDMHPYVFKTTDGGGSWRSIAGDLPAGTVVKTVTEDPVNRDLLFAGTEFGLYWTFDGGGHWSRAAGGIPSVMVDRVLVNPRTHDLILGTHGRSIIVLDDIAFLEAGNPAVPRDPLELFPIRAATEWYLWRELPVPGAAKFAAPNPPVGAFITYDIAAAAPADTAAIEVVDSAGTVVRHLTGPGGPGLHRVVWDLRNEFRVPPPPDEGGWFGTLHPPYVLPGTYTVHLSAGGRTQTQTVQVMIDARVRTTPAALRARMLAGMRIGELNRVSADGASAVKTLDAELAGLRAAVAQHAAASGADSTLEAATARLDSIGAKFRSGFGAPVGRALDLLGALEASSLAPTEAQQRTLDQVTAELTTDVGALNEFITQQMPALRARIGAGEQLRWFR